jgi:ATP-binding cassette subfamily B protein
VTSYGTVVRRSGGWLPLIAVSDLTTTLITLTLPLVLGRTIDALVAGTGSAPWLLASCALIGVVTLCGLLDAYSAAACVARTTAWLRKSVVSHLLAVGPQNSRKFETGDLVSRVSGNTTEAAQAGPGAIRSFTGALPPIGSLVLLAYINLWLAAALVAGLCLVSLILLAFTRRTAQVIGSYQLMQNQMAGRLIESLTGARTIAAAGTVEQEERRVLSLLAKLHEEGRKTWAALSRATSQATLVGPLVLVIVLAVGGLLLTNGRISPGDLFAASQYAALGAGLGSLTGVLSQVARAKAGVRRVGEVLDLPAVRYGEVTLPDGPGQLTFHEITVRAEESTLLDDVTLSLPGGAAVAVVGESGAGKSVLAAVAARLHEPDEGWVELDGVPLTELSHESLRDAVGCAFERPVLVGNTVGDAISPHAATKQVRKMATATHAHEFVSRLPEGYRTALAEAPMSGGERQRLGLARAWDAERLLVLDDATSSLDMVTEMQISRTLTGDAGKRTRLIVTHRAATAARADLVVWLENGKLRGVGKHEELWREQAYREIFG